MCMNLSAKEMAIKLNEMEDEDRELCLASEDGETLRCCMDAYDHADKLKKMGTVELQLTALEAKHPILRANALACLLGKKNSRKKCAKILAELEPDEQADMIKLMTPIDRADVLELCTHQEDRKAIWDAMPTQLQAEALTNMAPETQKAVLLSLPIDQKAEMLSYMLAACMPEARPGIIAHIPRKDLAAVIKEIKINNETPGYEEQAQALAVLAKPPPGGYKDPFYIAADGSDKAGTKMKATAYGVDIFMQMNLKDRSNVILCMPVRQQAHTLCGMEHADYLEVLESMSHEERQLCEITINAQRHHQDNPPSMENLAWASALMKPVELDDSLSPEELNAAKERAMQERAMAFAYLEPKEKLVVVNQVEQMTADSDRAVVEMLECMCAADLAESLSVMDKEMRRTVWKALGPKDKAGALNYLALPDWGTGHVYCYLVVRELIRDMGVNEAAEVLAKLPETRREAVLAKLAKGEFAEDLRDLIPDHCKLAKETAKADSGDDKDKLADPQGPNSDDNRDRCCDDGSGECVIC